MCTPTPALFSHSKATTQVCYSVSDTQRTQPARRKAHGEPGEELHHQEHCMLPSSTRSCPPRGGGGHAPHGGLQQPSCHPLGPCWLSPKDQAAPTQVSSPTAASQLSHSGDASQPPPRLICAVLGKQTAETQGNVLKHQHGTSGFGRSVSGLERAFKRRIKPGPCSC